MINIKTEQLKLAGTIIDEVSRSGANEINNVQYELKDPSAYRAEAIAVAAAHAIEKAKVLSKATNQRLVRILAIQLEEPQEIVPLPRAKSAFFLNSQNASITPIQPGNVEVSASVSLIYEISDFTSQE